MPTRKKAAKKSIYQIKVTLLGSKPPIWRRFQVESDITLGDVHDILQDVMGWNDSHLHQFIIDQKYYGIPMPGEIFDLEVEDEEDYRLDQVIKKEKQKFVYEYDFGDSWEHALEVEKILPREKNVVYPRCLDGRLACPPDDCGGIWGYYDMLEIVTRPKHPEYEEMLDWLGEDFNPEEFDLDRINKSLPAACSHSRSRDMFV